MPPLAPMVPSISGTTDVYLILGDPVEQARAPESFNLIFARMGIDAVLVPVHVAPENLAVFVRTAFLAKNIKGMWVTIPHKAPIMGVLDDSDALGWRRALRRRFNQTRTLLQLTAMTRADLIW